MDMYAASDTKRPVRLSGGAPDAGWTSYASLSLYSPGHGIDFYVLGLQISGAGTLISGINFIVTIITMRAPGMTFMRMPLFTWTTLVSSTLILFAFPPLTVGLFLMLVVVFLSVSPLMPTTCPRGVSRIRPPTSLLQSE